MRLVTGGLTLQRAERVLKRAKCEASHAVGDLVRFSAFATTGPPALYQVALVDPTDRLRSKVEGIIFTKDTLDPTICTVMLHGPIPRTWYTGLQLGPLFVSLAGRLTNTPPSPGGTGVNWQQCGTAFDDVEAMFSPGTPIWRLPV